MRDSDPSGTETRFASEASEASKAGICSFMYIDFASTKMVVESFIFYDVLQALNNL